MDPNPKQLAYLFRSYLALEIKKEIVKESDENKSLRKALLALISLQEESKDPALSDFIKFLTTEFKPITNNLTNNTHEVWDGVDLAIRKDHNGEVIVVWKDKTIKKLQEDFKYNFDKMPKDIYRENKEELELLKIATKRNHKSLIKKHTERYCWLP